MPLDQSLGPVQVLQFFMVSKHLDQVMNPFPSNVTIPKGGLDCQNVFIQDLIILLSGNKFSRIIGNTCSGLYIWEKPPLIAMLEASASMTKACVTSGWANTGVEVKASLNCSNAHRASGDQWNWMLFQSRLVSDVICFKQFGMNYHKKFPKNSKKQL